MSVPEDIQRLASQVPSPPGEPLPPGASDDEIDAFSKRTGVQVPTDLREWWKFTNGPCIGPGGMYGIRPQREHLDLEGVYQHHPEWQRLNWIPVAGDGCGNEYVLTVTPESGPLRPVYFFEHEQSDPRRFEYVVASGLWQFLRFLLREEMGGRGWPFDRDFVLKADPDLTACSTLPWDK